MEKLSNELLTNTKGGTIDYDACADIIDAMFAEGGNAARQAAYILTSSTHFTC